MVMSRGKREGNGTVKGISKEERNHSDVKRKEGRKWNCEKWRSEY